MICFSKINIFFRQSNYKLIKLFIFYSPQEIEQIGTAISKHFGGTHTLPWL